MHFTNLSNEDEIDSAYRRWSKGVEMAVQQTIGQQHHDDPLRNPFKQLPKKFLADVKRRDSYVLLPEPYVGIQQMDMNRR